MYRTNIYLDEEQVRALRHLAAEQGCTLSEAVRRAVDRYIAAELVDDTGWRERLDDFLVRVRARLPETVSTDDAAQIEADITAAREEVRRAHRARAASSR
jgi:hypothetical protein